MYAASYMYIDSGYDANKQAERAGHVCGSCYPLIQHSRTKIRGKRWLEVHLGYRIRW